MEADSTTVDKRNLKTGSYFPFTVQPGNLKLYLDIISNQGEGSRELQLVRWLQSFGLLPQTVRCRTGGPECRMVCKPARVVDRVQWVCESCSQRLPVRQGSFFLRVQCSLLQSIQIILAWCEDADWEQAASFFDVKPKVVSQIYDRLDQLAIDKLAETQLGGEDAVVLLEMYPDCLNRLSPDTTDQTHVHRILMMADTKHIPTRYRLHVIKQDARKTLSDCESLEDKWVSAQAAAAARGSLLVAGGARPALSRALDLQSLLPLCDADMQHFLCNRIWRGALSLCAAARDVCAGGAGERCALAVQRYLDTALYRQRFGDGFFDQVLRNIAEVHRV